MKHPALHSCSHVGPKRNVVIKLGGSIVFRPEVRMVSILEAIRNRDNERVFVLIGGGDTVESMRTLHAIYPALDPIAMHWRCIRLLDATWEVACELFSDAIPICDWNGLTQASKSNVAGTFLVRPSAFYSEDLLEKILPAWLPATSWETTSDTLAWLLAKVIDASEVRLAKGCECDPSWNPCDAAQLGIIDSELARLATKDDHPVPITIFQL